MKRTSVRFNYLICIYLLGIAVFTLFRIAGTVAFCAQHPDTAGLFPLYWKTLWTGFRFDTVVSTYMLALPLLMLIVGEVAHIGRRWYYAIVHYLLMVLYTVCFFACAADIPYFSYFFARLDVAALSWVDDFGTSASMILHEPQYALYLLAFLVAAVGWWLLGRLVFRRVLLRHLDSYCRLAWTAPTAVLLLGLGFLGMRGKVSKIPIRVSTAYFCSNPVLNQLGLNPVFTFLKSMEDAGKSANQPIGLLPPDEVSTALEEHFNSLNSNGIYPPPYDV